MQWTSIIMILTYILIALGSYFIGCLHENKRLHKLFLELLKDLLPKELPPMPDIPCMVCKTMRNWDQIKVITHDVSMAHGFEKEGSFSINVHYCADNLECFEVAHVIDKWEKWPQKN